VTRFAPLFPAGLLLVAASAPLSPSGDTLDSALKQARAEQHRAEFEAARLTKAADAARNETEKLRAREAAAAQAIDAAEARITVADTNLRLITAAAELRRAQLEREQQPIASLLAGLAMMARRPPLLAVADDSSTDELVRVRVLLGSTLPAIRRRTAALSAQLAATRELAESTRAAKAELEQSRQAMFVRRQQFAALEIEAAKVSASAQGEALASGDVALAAGENVAGLTSADARSRVAREIASELAGAEPALLRPVAPEGRGATFPPYMLPVVAPVTQGLGAVDANGVRSRGLVLASSRGASVLAPASGVIRFAGPYRSHDGVIIVDHGDGWISLLVGVSSTLKAGDRVATGAPLGRALGPIEIQLSQNGRRLSPALIAGSSRTLSNKSKSG
jgi:septal ring factor EnvC (AmiA/AmiB activator)